MPVSYRKFNRKFITSAGVTGMSDSWPVAYLDHSEWEGDIYYLCFTDELNLLTSFYQFTHKSHFSQQNICFTNQFLGKCDHRFNTGLKTMTSVVAGCRLDD